MPLVTVIIPTYNQAEFLRDALVSVIKQSITDWEVVVVNNYSSDETIGVIENFNDKRIKLINFNNYGVIGASRNVGIEKANSPWIAFLDSDDIWYPEKLEYCLEHTRVADIVAHRQEWFNNKSIIGRSTQVKTADLLYENLLFRGNCLTPSSSLVRRSILKQVRGFSESKNCITAEDYDLWLKLSQKKARFVFCDHLLTQYRVHEKNNSGSVAPHLNATLNVLNKHYTLLGSRKFLDRVRYKRIVAIQYYGAGRRCQKIGRRREALQYFVKCMYIYPLYMKNFIAMIFLLFKRN
jgi:teichuronic acid biosynthesis glycosyltransferase TuaG